MLAKNSTPVARLNASVAATHGAARRPRGLILAVAAAAQPWIVKNAA